ncbi:dGTP triphosphohydrolase [Pedobacter borealis]|uniref:dGTP triphosphohydrolase n=1 Tax=Pedobacter borealis TaxID=475254 RepID=UPI0004938CFE|nr:dNTP triphosphohydrolase [Pedobacter borealis]
MNWKKLLNDNRLRESTRLTDSRNEFESDYGRVLFSPALRRMHDKTQVFPLTADDNIHSRLTHSMEVMAIGYSLGLDILKNDEFVNSTGFPRSELERIIPIILQSSCLVHDIGNPPFGHFGETVIKNYFKNLFTEDEKLGDNKKYNLTEEEKGDFTLFDGNAQGFRILTKLQVLDDAYGLNLTLGTLASYIKYPNDGDKNDDVLSKHKRGIFQSEKKYFEKITSECGLTNSSGNIRHPLAFLMEAADSICYLVMDMEDGFNKKWYKYSGLKTFFSETDNLDTFFDFLDTKYPGEELEVTRVVKFRIEVIRRLVSLASKKFIDNIESIYAGTYNCELIFDCKLGLAERFQDFCKKHILPNREILSLEMTGHSVLSGLLKFYTDFLFYDDTKYTKKAQGMLSNSIVRASLLENDVKNFDELSHYYKLRVIVDYISGMTDQFALNQFQKLSGQKIN